MFTQLTRRLPVPTGVDMRGEIVHSVLMFQTRRPLRQKLDRSTCYWC